MGGWDRPTEDETSNGLGSGSERRVWKWEMTPVEERLVIKKENNIFHQDAEVAKSEIHFHWDWDKQYFKSAKDCSMNNA